MFGELLGAGASLLGGLMGQNAAEKMYEKQWKDQKLVLQNQIRWKVKDAQAAGIHPLYALGAPTSSFTSMMSDPGYGIGQGLRDAGQDIGSAVQAYQSKDARALDAAQAQLGLERAGLENELLRSQIRRINSPGGSVGPPGGMVNPSGGKGAWMKTPIGPMWVPDPMAGQKSENWTGDNFIGDTITGGNTLDDVQRNIEADVRRYGPRSKYLFGRRRDDYGIAKYIWDGLRIMSDSLN